MLKAVTSSSKTSGAPDKSPDKPVKKPGKVLQLVPGTKLWERQPTESSQAYEAFTVYLKVKEENAGGLREVARRLGKSAALMDRWSKRDGWVERHRAWENHQLMLLEREKAGAARERAKEWAKRRIDIREKGFEAGQALFLRAQNLLKLPVFDKRVEKTVTAQSGEEIETVTILEFQQSPRDARLMLETALKLMRLSADMSTENIDIPIDKNLDDLSDEEIDAYIAEIGNLRKQALGGSEE